MVLDKFLQDQVTSDPRVCVGEPSVVYVIIVPQREESEWERCVMMWCLGMLFLPESLHNFKNINIESRRNGNSVGIKSLLKFLMTSEKISSAVS